MAFTAWSRRRYSAWTRSRCRRSTPRISQRSSATRGLSPQPRCAVPEGDTERRLHQRCPRPTAAVKEAEAGYRPRLGGWSYSAAVSCFGLIADAHANLPATEAALAALESAHCDEVIHVGDAVGIGPHPSEVVSVLV